MDINKIKTNNANDSLAKSHINNYHNCKWSKLTVKSHSMAEYILKKLDFCILDIKGNTFYLTVNVSYI